MDALEAVLRPVAGLLNRNIAESTPALELCERLSGKIIAVRVKDTALCASFVISDDAVDLVESTDEEPDVIIAGSMLTLLGLIRESGEDAVRDGSLDLTGDARLADHFQQLLTYAKPDIEEEFSNLVGDAAAHRLGEFARDIGRWGRETRSTMGANIREYLQEESRDAPSRFEVEEFAADVGKLRDDVDRVEARVKRLEAGD